MEQFKKLYDIIATLRGKGGCPWDAEQTIQSMRPHIIEETYEVVDAIDADSTHDLLEELGDLMFLTVFVSYIAEQAGRFKVQDVVDTVTEKLIRRHPHVFAEVEVENVSEVLKNWESIKLSEKKNEHRKTIFDGIPRALPEMDRFRKTLQKLAREGVDLKDYLKPDWKAQAAALQQEFKADQLKNTLKDLLIEADLQDIDSSALLAQATSEIQQEYLKKHSK